jgi:hypothetical protein
LYGVALVPYAVATRSPVGVDWKLRSTVTGCSSTLVVPVVPVASVAVKRSSRYEGYSWSGAVNVPDATPEIVWMTCVWQPVEQ